MPDTLTSAFEVRDAASSGQVLHLSFQLTQFVSAPDANGLAYLRQDYAVTNVSPSAIAFELARSYDADLTWDGDFSNDWVGGNSAGGWRFVFQQEPSNPAAAVTLGSLSSPSAYYASKRGVLPGNVAPAFSYGTSTVPWLNYGIPANWRSFIAGVGYNTNGISGDVGTAPKDAGMGLAFDMTLASRESRAITLMVTYGSTGPLLPCRRCDVYRNERIDGQDIQRFLIALLNPGSATAIERCAADLNEDGRIDSADVGLFVSSLLNAACPL